MPIYGVTDYVECCLESVMAQTYNDIECIIVDDASLDDSIVKCEKMIASYRGSIKFSILHHEHNRGLSAARNTGTKAAVGDYVFYLDSDDKISSTCIENLLNPVLKNPSIEIVMGRINHFPVASQQRKVFTDQEFKSLEAVRDYAFGKKGYAVYSWNKLIRRDFLVKNQLFFQEGLLWEDLLWNFYLLKVLHHLYVISDVTYYYRTRPHSISTGTHRAVKCRSLDIIYETIADNLTEEDWGREAKYHYKGFQGYFIRNLRKPEAVVRAKRFKETLAEEHSSKEIRNLCILLWLSKTMLGRALVSNALKIRDKYLDAKIKNYKCHMETYQ